MTPNKRNKLSNAAALLNIFCVRKILFSSLKDYSWTKYWRWRSALSSTQGPLRCRPRYGNFHEMVKSGAYMRWQEVVFGKRWCDDLVPWLKRRAWCYQRRAWCQYFVRKKIAYFSRSQTHHAATELQNFSVHTTRASILRIITISVVVPLVETGVLQFSKISLTQFAMQSWCLFVELIHWKTVVIFVHINTSSTVTVNARQISFFKREARKTACLSNF